MANKISIYLDYKNSINQAEDFSDAANKIRKKKDKLQTLQTELSNDWKGDNATKYIKKLESIISDLEKIATKLDTAAQTVEFVANNTYKAEKETLEIAETRTY